MIQASPSPLKREFCLSGQHDQLPPQELKRPVRATRDDNGDFDVFMASGCNSELEGELQFYGQISGVIGDTLKALSEAVG